MNSTECGALCTSNQFNSLPKIVNHKFKNSFNLFHLENLQIDHNFLFDAEVFRLNP
jgi:hypothetical protein